MAKKLLFVLLVLAMLRGTTALAQLQLVSPFAGSSCGGSTFANAISAAGVFTCGTPSVGSVLLNNIGAATGANTIANGNNTGHVWNWANTSDSTTVFTFGETSAATNGTSSGGVPNQVLLKAATLSTSTQSPLSIYSRGNHVFSVSSSTAQILVTDGSTSNPAYSFASTPSSGMILNGGHLALIGGGTVGLQYVAPSTIRVPAGSVGQPGLTDLTSANAGLFWPASGAMGISAGFQENSRFTSGVFQTSKGSSDGVSYSFDVRKARGSVVSPTVISSGDELLQINSYGYVGGTNTYRNAATISFTSTGTISDATNGIGGNVRLSTQKQGTDTSPQERMRVDQLGHIISIAGTANTPSMGTCGTSPSVAGTDNAMLVTVGTGGAATSCAVNFGSTWAGNAPACVAQNDTDIAAYRISTSTSAVTITGSAAFTASSKFQIGCLGRQ